MELSLCLIFLTVLDSKKSDRIIRFFRIYCHLFTYGLGSTDNFGDEDDTKRIDIPEINF